MHNKTSDLVNQSCMHWHVVAHLSLSLCGDGGAREPWVRYLVAWSGSGRRGGRGSGDVLEEERSTDLVGS